MKIDASKAGDTTLYICAVFAALLVALWVASGYLFVVSRADREDAAARPVEDHAFMISQFEHESMRGEITVQRYRLGEAGLDDVRLQFKLLQSKLGLLSAPSDATQLLAEVPSYRRNVQQLQAIVARIGLLMQALPGDRDTPARIGDEYESMRGPLVNLEVSVGDAEARWRDALYADYRWRRTLLIGSSIGATVILMVLAYLFVSNARRLRSLGMQQRTALQRETEAALAVANAANAKNAFLGMIGHELRTPLQSIMTAIDVLSSRDLRGPDKLLLEQLARAAESLDAQMQDLTDFSKMEAGQLKLRTTTFDIREVVMAAVESVDPQVDRKGLGLELDLDERPSLHVSDPYRIQQIITNLLVNAVKYTDAGTITLRTQLHRGADDDAFVVEVRDTGAGMDPAEIEKIFMPFVQLDASSTRRYGGIGMGLAIVERLVDLLGASLTVDSSPGKGSTFVVRFPLKRATADGGSDVRWSRKRVVLVVDDQEPVRVAIAALLASRGIDCVTAQDASSAFAAMDERPFDAILLDINMPDKDGVMLAREVRERSDWNRTAPLVAFSALGPDMLPPESVALFEHYLIKPVRADVLSLALNSVWARSDLSG
ncbi:hybrid sensor histidine kinase/response regulator [Burkholderia anthina]|uniref:ATP-binding response regulator n=1 Tax=Burkholderia anthina TaxID=179879 RepID=UPI0037C09E71